MMDALAKLPVYDEYKKTRVKWLEEVPSHWDEYPICSKAKLKSITNKVGEDLLSVYLDKGVIRFDEVEQKRTNVTSLDLSKYQLVEVGDFVLNNQQAWRGSVGVSSYTGIVSPAYLVLSLEQDLLPNFANYLFRDGGMVSHYLISSKGVGTIQRNLYWPQLKRAPLFIPPVEEQISIANFLDQKTAQIDEAISFKEKQIALLKERKQIIIKKAVTQGLNTDVQMKDSGVDWIGQIPEHWKVKKLKFFCKFNGGGTPSKDNMKFWEDGNIPWVSPKDMKSDRIDKTQDYITQLAVKNSATNYVSPNSLLIVVRSGILQRKIPVAINDVTVTLNQDMKALSLHKNVMSSEYLKYFIEGNNDSLLVEWTKEGATVESIEHEFIANGQIPIPPLEEQEKIVEYLNKLDESMHYTIENQIVQIGRLKEYRTTLINSAVTGKIKVA